MKNRFSTDEAGDIIELTRSEMGLPKIQINNIQNIIDFISDLDSISKMDIVRLAEMNVVLQAYAAYVQEETNRYLRYINFAKDNIDFIISAEWSNTNGDYLDAKRIQILAHHTKAAELHNMKLVAQLKYDTLRELSDKISKISKSLETLIYAKKQFTYKN